jgi:hypothetical protein
VFCFVFSCSSACRLNALVFGFGVIELIFNPRSIN